MASTKSAKGKRKVKPLKPYTPKSFSLHQKASALFGFIFIVLGSAIIFVASAITLNIDLKHPFLEPVKPQVVTHTAKPTQLYIPKLSRVFNVSDGQYVNNQWTIAQQGVSYLTSSATPGKGNSVIYGHNKDDIFGYLYLVRNDDPIYVVESDGSIVKYKVAQTKEITPNQVEILNATRDSRLTLYTCSGFLDSARFVVVAEQIS